MENSNRKPGQGKTPQQYKDSSRFAWYSIIGMIILLTLVSLFSCSHRIHVITEYDGDREIKWYTTNKN